MRRAFIKTLLELAEKDQRIYLLTGDLGYHLLEPFRDTFPDRFYNLGLTEQNMIGVAAGLAASGKIPFVYSIVPFVTMRCFEQIQIDVAYQNLPVRIVGYGEGLTYGNQGPTHHATGDLALMRSLPNMTVLNPSDPFETDQCVRELISLKGPAYLRLGVDHGRLVKSFKFTKASKLRDGSHAITLAIGAILSNVLKAMELLDNGGVHVELWSVHSLKPLDISILRGIKKPVFTVEEHSIIGGLGNTIAELLAENGSNVPFRRIGLPDIFQEEIGGQEFLQRKNGLSPEGIAQQVLDAFALWQGS